MGEVANLCKVWEDEFNKLLGYQMPVEAAPPTNHEVHMLHHKNGVKIVECLSHYAPRLPHFASVPRLLSFGTQLIQKQEYDLAVEDCFQYVLKINLPSLTETPRIDELGRISYHVQAVYGNAVCLAHLQLRKDVDIKHPETVQRLMRSLQEIREGIESSMQYESLYWLTLNVSTQMQRSHLLTFACRLHA